MLNGPDPFWRNSSPVLWKFKDQGSDSRTNPNKPMEPGLMLATLMNLEILVEHILDVGMTMLEDEPSLLHAKNA